MKKLLFILFLFPLFVKAQSVCIAASTDTIITLPNTKANLAGCVNGLTNPTYQWQQVQGPAGATIASPSALATTVSGLVLGTYYFQIIATDQSGRKYSDGVLLTVFPAPCAICPIMPNFIVRSYTNSVLSQQTFYVLKDSTVVSTPAKSVKLTTP